MFAKAQRKQAKLRLALCGPSGSGKTYSALLLAQGLGGRVAMIDTEHGSGELYADLIDYDVAPVAAPYSPARYIAAIRAAEAAGYSVLIIDGLSHAWAGEGGVLEILDNTVAASRSNNSYAAWREVTPQHNALVEAILGAKLHVIATMRSKTAYEIVEDDKGKKAPKKIGLAPIQRDGMEYEFTVVMDISVDSHVATASKDRTRLFDGQHIKLTAKHGKQLKDWLESGAPALSGRARFEAAVAAAETEDALRDIFEEGRMYCKLANDLALWGDIKAAIDARRAVLTAGEAPAAKPKAAKHKAAEAKPDPGEIYDYESGADQGGPV